MMYSLKAEIALNLSALPESLRRIYERVKNTNISKEKLEETLDHLVNKGAITLVEKVKATKPPKNHDTLYKKIMMQKLGSVGAMKVMKESFLEKKI